MCGLYANQDPENYASRTRSIRIDGVPTSVRLEAAFWHIVEEIAAGESITPAQFVTKLYNEVIEKHGEIHNLSSLLRVCCLLYLENRAALDREDGRGVRLHPGESRRAVA
jgi:predicted DNA-binding ribbon-helix-helix protein